MGLCVCSFENCLGVLYFLLLRHVKAGVFALHMRRSEQVSCFPPASLCSLERTFASVNGFQRWMGFLLWPSFNFQWKGSCWLRKLPLRLIMGSKWLGGEECVMSVLKR